MTRNRLNRHSQMKRHKRKLKKRYAMIYGDRTNINLLRDEMREQAQEDTLWNRKHPRRNDGFQYWSSFYRSGRKKFAKHTGNRVIRQHYRTMMSKMDPEEIPAYRGSGYERIFDYSNAVW